MDKNNRFVKLLLFPSGMDDYVIIYGFSTNTDRKEYQWRKHIVPKSRQIICTAILSYDEADKFEYELTTQGKVKIGDVVFSSPQLIKRPVVLYNTGDTAERNPVSKCGQLIEYWEIDKEAQLKKIQTAYNTDGKQLFNDIKLLLSWATQECGIDFTAESHKFGNYEHYEISPFAIAFDIEFNKALENKQISVIRKQNTDTEAIVNCIAYHHGRCLINKIRVFPAYETRLMFSSDEPMTHVTINIWDAQHGNLLYTNDIILITSIGLSMELGATPYRISDPWSQKILESSSNRCELIKDKIETVRRISSVTNFQIQSSSSNCIDIAFSSAHRFLSPYKKQQTQGAFIRNKGNDGEIESFLKIMEYIDQNSVSQVIIADPYFSVQAAMKMLGRINRTNIHIDIITSLCEINPDTGETADIRTVCKTFLKHNVPLLPPNLSVSNLQRGNKPVFHDRYLLRIHSDGRIDGFLLSNSLNSMGQFYPFVIAPLEYDVCLDVYDYLNWMCDPDAQSKEQKKSRIICEVWYDSNSKLRSSTAPVFRVPLMSKWLDKWCDSESKLSIPKNELSQAVSAIWGYWILQKEEACLLLSVLGTIQHPWDVRNLAEELRHVECAQNEFLTAFPTLASQVEKKQKHLEKGIDSQEYTVWSLLSGHSQPDTQGFHKLLDHAGHIWYSGDSWITGGYRLMLALNPALFIEVLEKTSSPLMFDVLATYMIFYPWSDSVFQATANSHNSCLSILAAEYIFCKFVDTKLSPGQIQSLFNQLPPSIRISQTAYLLSRITFVSRTTRMENTLTDLWYTLRTALLQYCSTDFNSSSDETCRTALRWLYDCEEISCCKLHLDLAELITDSNAKYLVLDKAIRVMTDSLLHSKYERDLSENILLLLNAMDQRHGSSSEQLILGKIVKWEFFEAAVEPELKTYNFAKWNEAYVRAQWQIKLLRIFHVKYPDAEKTAKWLSVWDDLFSS